MNLDLMESQEQSRPGYRRIFQEIVKRNPNASPAYASWTLGTLLAAGYSINSLRKNEPLSREIAIGSLGTLGVHLAATGVMINRITKRVNSNTLSSSSNDEKKLGEEEKPILGGLGPWDTLGWQEKVEFVLKGTGCSQNGLTITGYNGKTYTLRTPTDEEQNKINEAPTPAAVSILLIPLVVPLRLNIYWNGDKAELIDADTEQSINICTGASTAGGPYPGGGDGPG